jgi:hypothetical protein
MEFITQKEDGKYVISSVAVDFLQKIGTANVSVIGIVGSYRKGKSTLLNKLIGMPVFGTSSSTKPKTKGLWVAELSPGILLMDAEGLGATDQTETNDFNIFSLCVLLSSVLVYNNDGPITSDSIQSLRLAGKLASLIRNMAKVKLTDTALVWLARNFMLDMVDASGKPCNGNTYLECHIGSNPGVMELFPRRSFYSLPSPAESPKDIAAMTKLTPDFVFGVKSLKEKLIQNACPKQCNGISFTGQTLLVLAKTIVENINSGQVMNLIPVWDASVQARELEAKAKAKLFLEQQQTLHIQLLVKAMDIYNSHAIEREGYHEAFIDISEFFSKIEEQRFQHWLRDMSSALVPKYIQRYIEPILQKELCNLNQNLEQARQECINVCEKLQVLKQKQEKEFTSMEQVYQEKLKAAEQHDVCTKEELIQLKSKLSDLEVSFAIANAKYNDMSEDLEEAQLSVTETTTLNLQIKHKLKTTESERESALAEADHLRLNINEQINEVKSTVTKQRLQNETTQKKLIEYEVQLTKIENEKDEMEEKHKKELQNCIALLNISRKECEDNKKELEQNKRNLIQVETELKIVKEKEDVVSKKRHRAEKLEANITWFEKQHETDVENLKQEKKEKTEWQYKAIKYELALSLHKEFELEVSSSPLLMLTSKT